MPRCEMRDRAPQTATVQLLEMYEAVAETFARNMLGYKMGWCDKIRLTLFCNNVGYQFLSAAGYNLDSFNIWNR